MINKGKPGAYFMDCIHTSGHRTASAFVAGSASTRIDLFAQSGTWIDCLAQFLDKWYNNATSFERKDIFGIFYSPVTKHFYIRPSMAFFVDEVAFHLLGDVLCIDLGNSSNIDYDKLGNHLAELDSFRDERYKIIGICKEHGLAMPYKCEKTSDGGLCLKWLLSNGGKKYNSERLLGALDGLAKIEEAFDFYSDFNIKDIICAKLSIKDAEELEVLLNMLCNDV